MLRERLPQPDLSPAIGAARLLLDRGRIRPIRPTALARFARDRIGHGGGPQWLLPFHALNAPDALAIVDGGGVRRTYSDLDRRVNRVAHGLARLGVGPGDRIAVMLPNRPEAIELTAAAGYCGAVVVQVGYRLKAAEVAYLVRDSGARA